MPNSANFPIIAITLRNTLRQLFGGPGSRLSTEMQTVGEGLGG